MKDMTAGSVTKNILVFSVPMLLGNVFQQFYNVVDSIVVGRFIGKGALGAVGVCFPIIFFIVALIMGATMGSMVLIAQFFGAKNYEKLRATVDTTYIVMFFTALLMTFVGLLTSGYILRLLGTPFDVIKDAKTYLDIIFIGLISIFGYNGLSAIMRGVGDSKTPLYLLIVSSLINIVLDLLFVLVFRWGVAGVAWATVIAQTISFAMGVVILNMKNPLLSLRIRNCGFDKKIFTESIRIGLPSGAQQMFVSLGMMALTKIVNGFGTNALTAFTAAGRIDSFAMMPAMNFSMALSTFTGQNIGAEKMERVSKGLKSTLLMSIIYSLVVTLVIYFKGGDLIRIFNTDPEVVRIGKEYLLIVSSFYIAFSVMFASNGLLRGAGDTLIPMIITLFSLWAFRVPLSFFLSRFMGTAGIWWGIPVAWCFGAFASLLYYKSGNWRKRIAIRNFNASKVAEGESINEVELEDLEKKEYRL
ncbi:MATE family efflux transporter [candidate division WOR-3 bacterium]|nr:MATE family efflux transporter [candidate division WOR-3 bacterium]